MALSTSIGLSFSDIQDEFEPNRPLENISLGSYRLSDSVGIKDTNGDPIPLYTASPELPSSGSIKVSNFNGAKKTIVIRYNYQGTDSVTYVGRTLSRDFQKLDPQAPWVPQVAPANIGSGVTNAYGTGFTIYKITPTPTQRNIVQSTLDNALDARVIISIGGSLGSRNLAKTSCALYLDSAFKVQDAANHIIVETENGSLISGCGGAGGAGGSNIAGSPLGVGFSGGVGSSAVGIGTSISSFKNRGTIQAGAGGGGGGASIVKSRTSATGGGGGGGAGYPPSLGGAGGSIAAGVGLPGTKTTGGTGGTGGTSGSDVGGSGGQGGSIVAGVANTGTSGNIPASSNSVVTNQIGPIGISSIYTTSGGNFSAVNIGDYVFYQTDPLAIPRGTVVTAKESLGGSNRSIEISNSLVASIPSGATVFFSPNFGGGGGDPGYAVVIAPNTPTPTITNLVAGASRIGITTINTVPTT